MRMHPRHRNIRSPRIQAWAKEVPRAPGEELDDGHFEPTMLSRSETFKQGFEPVKVREMLGRKPRR